MQATVVAPSTPPVPLPSGRRALTGGVYRPGVPPAPATTTCVWCGKSITADQHRMKVGMAVLHDEPATPCVAEFEDMAYRPLLLRRVR